ncbi:MAG: hypothetical protein M3P04_12255, partial [Actinomycetota bacterium]|nr:hypothetical protein [Actinomycetota bacterium]
SKATGGAEGRPTAADATQFPEALQGFLTLAELPRPLPWSHDSQASSAELRCGDALVATTAPPAARTWEATSDGVAAPPPAITLTFAKTSDTTTATAGFAACKQGYSQKGAVDDPPDGGVGDESFLYAADPDVTLLVVRSGSSYLSVRYATGAYDDTKAIALAALDSFATAGRL